MSEVAPGVWMVSLSTPWAVGPVNVYVLDDDPLTLIDTGAIFAPSEAELEGALRQLGRRVEDLERVIVSHQHVDHWGLAQTLVERSGAELCALDAFARWLTAYPASLEAEDRLAAELLNRHGGSVGGTGAGVYRGETAFAAPVSVTQEVRDGDVVGFADRRLRVLHRPGHSPSDTVFHDEDRGVLFGADHLMARPSTAILTPPLDGSSAGRRPPAFADYLASLRATAAMELDLVLPGHGEPLAEPGRVLDERFRRYDRLTERVAAAVDAEPRTARTIAEAVRGPIADRGLFFALCDVLGYLDELIDAGRVIEDDGADGVTRFVRAV